MILVTAERDVAAGVAVTVGVAAAAEAAAGAAVTATDVIATHAAVVTTEKDVIAAVIVEAAAVVVTVVAVVAAIVAGEGIAGTTTEAATDRGQIAETEVGTGALASPRGQIGEIVWIEDLLRRRGLDMTITKKIMAASTKTLLFPIA